jgi:hypothetical protein
MGNSFLELFYLENNALASILIIENRALKFTEALESQAWVSRT